jgi:integrase/recombinase XerD
MEVQKAVEAFLFHCKVEKNLNSKTIKAYQTDLKQFISHLNSIGIVSFENVGKSDIKSFLEQLSDFAPKTMKRKVATLKALFNYHEFEENIAMNPFRKLKICIKIPFQLPTVMSLSQIEKILFVTYHARNIAENKKDYSYREKIRDVAVIELLFATGVRVSELCNLTVDHINGKFSMITVDGKGSKQRVLPIPNQAVKKALNDYYQIFKPHINHYFFINRLNNRLSEQSVRHMVNKYSALANTSKHITPHAFRHTFATLLLEQDVDIRYIQNLLGHSSISTTQIYTHVNNKKEFEILVKKHPRNRVSL